MLGLYAVPVALFLAQLQNAVSYSRFVARQIPIFDHELQSILTRFLLVTVAVLALHLGLRNDGDLIVYANLLILGMWVVLGGKETLASFRFITTRGEIR